MRDDPQLRGREDAFHNQNARQLGRYLLTYDEDFWNDRLYPINTCSGLIILPENAGGMAKHFPALLRALTDHNNPLPEPIYLDEIKVRPTWENITIKMIDHDTQKQTTQTWIWPELGLKGNR